MLVHRMHRIPSLLRSRHATLLPTRGRALRDDTKNGCVGDYRIPGMECLGTSLFPSGWDACPSQGIQHEATRSITIPLWMGCLSITGRPAWSDQEHHYSPLDGMLVHHRASSMKRLGALLFPHHAYSSQGTQHEATRSITIPLWTGCLSITGHPAWSDQEHH